jgi:putative transposase
LPVSSPVRSGEAIETAGIAFKKALIEAVLSAELGRHLGYAFGSDRPDDGTNHRNGSQQGCRPATASRGSRRRATAKPASGRSLCPSWRGVLPALTDKIAAPYAHGLTVREIQGYLVELYGLC